MVMFNVGNWGKTISFVFDLLAFIHTLQLELLETLQVCAVTPFGTTYSNNDNVHFMDIIEHNTPANFH